MDLGFAFRHAPVSTPALITNMIVSIKQRQLNISNKTLDSNK